MLSVIYNFLAHIIHFIFVKVIDLYRYFKNKEWLIFNGFGLHIYTGLFGSGKTSTMVYEAFKIANRYPQVTILTNIQLCNFPKHTQILHLTHYQQIITAPPNTLVLLDEISSIFNSRDWKKEGIPAPLLSMLLQVRKERKMIYATAQRFNHVDALIRQITFSVRECRCWAGRWNWVRTFDAWEYENDNIMRPARAYSINSFIQTDKVRELYDTYEMVEKIKKTEYMSDEEILERQGVVQNINVATEQKKKKRFVLF